MITVIATVTVKPQHREQFLTIFTANLPAVRAEAGCIEYYPAIDLDTGMARQTVDHNVVTVIEKWRDVEALKTHLASPHMRAYHQHVKDLVVAAALRIVEEVA